MPYRLVETCTCRIVRGCWVSSHIEMAEGACFIRLRVCGPGAREVLMDVIREDGAGFYQDFTEISGSGDPYRTSDGWWCAILAGKEPGHRQSTLVLAAPMVAWSAQEKARLREAYEADGIRGCLEALGDRRSYHAINTALSRYRIRHGVKPKALLEA